MVEMPKLCAGKRIKNANLREALAEFLGTFILTLIGNASIAVATFKGLNDLGSLMVPITFGLALLISISVSGGVSGGHVNPAVTLALVSVGKVSWKKIFPYFCGQYLGGFIAAVICYGVYVDSINNFDSGIRVVDGHNATAQIFATYPQPHVSTGEAFADQVVGTMLLMLAISAITDPHNMSVSKDLYPLLIGLSLTGIMIAFAYNCQAALNPARDLAPRVFTAIAGWGKQVFSFRDFNWFWVPLIGPHIGAILGAWIYKLTVEMHWPIESYDLPDSSANSDFEYKQKQEGSRVAPDKSSMLVTSSNGFHPTQETRLSQETRSSRKTQESDSSVP